MVPSVGAGHYPIWVIPSGVEHVAMDFPTKGFSMSNSKNGIGCYLGAMAFFELFLLIPGFVLYVSWIDPYLAVHRDSKWV